MLPDLRPPAGEELRGETDRLRGELETCRAEDARYAQTLAQVSARESTARAARGYEAELARRSEAMKQAAMLAQQQAAELAKRDGMIAQRNQQLAERDQQLAEKEQQLAQAAGRLDELRAQVQQLTAALTAQATELDRLSRENTANAGNLAAAREDIAQLEAVIRELRQHSGVVEHELNLIKRTRTWRFREMVITRLRAG